jgi:hypothetical protein
VFPVLQQELQQVSIQLESAQQVFQVLQLVQQVLQELQQESTQRVLLLE